MHELSAYRLENGVTVVHAARAGAVAAIEVWIGAGAADEPATRCGVAHALEHMLFRSSRGGDGVATAIAPLGGDVGAWTALDHTVVHATVPGRALPAAIAALADAMVHPRLSPDELDLERGVIAAELRDVDGDPRRAAAHALFRQLFLVHPYRRPVVGTPTSIATLTAHDLETFFRAHFVAAATTVIVVADADPATFAPAIARGFGAMPARPWVRLARGEPAQTALRVSTGDGVRSIGGRSQIAVGIRTAGADDPDRIALEVLAAALATSPGLGALELAAGHHVLRDGGAVVIAGATRDRPATAAGAIARALAQLATRLDAAALARAVSWLEDVRAEATAAGLARRIGMVAAELDVARLPAPRIGDAIASHRRALGERRHALSVLAASAVARDRLRVDRLAVAVLAPGRASARPVEAAVRRAFTARPLVARDRHLAAALVGDDVAAARRR